MGSSSGESRRVFFFDIDNCLYSRNKKVFTMMQELIDKFFVEHLSLSPEDAYMLHHKYYREYGLAIEGLARHHKVNPLEFNQKVDDALLLDDVLKPDPKLRKILAAFDTQKVKLWLFTNAHVTHGLRVVKLLGVDDLFEGITYCDYAAKELLCKPREDMFQKAERESAVSQKDKYDSALNCSAAFARGWRTVHLLEPDIPAPSSKVCEFQISNLSELQDIFPNLFKRAVNPWAASRPT